jgi:hypothetical protein
MTLVYVIRLQEPPHKLKKRSDPLGSRASVLVDRSPRAEEVHEGMTAIVNFVRRKLKSGGERSSNLLRVQLASVNRSLYLL